jgi:hypothetical protein
MTELDIACHRSAVGDGWICAVSIAVEGGTTTQHHVTVATADLKRLHPDAPDPHLLVDASFRFLLARESPASILASFDLMEIGRYFPDYESEIART